MEHINYLTHIVQESDLIALILTKERIIKNELKLKITSKISLTCLLVNFRIQKKKYYAKDLS